MIHSPATDNGHPNLKLVPQQHRSMVNGIPNQPDMILRKHLQQVFQQI
jgi:hypothetical protein